MFTSVIAKNPSHDLFISPRRQGMLVAATYNQKAE